MAYSAGVAVDWNFAETWTLSTGILYKEVGERGELIPADPGNQYFDAEQFSFKLCYLEIPININRNFGKNWLLEFGISPVIRLCAKYEFDNYDKLHLSNEFSKSKGLLANFGFGFRTKIGNSILKILPYAQIGITIGTEAAEYYWADLRYFSGGIKVVFVM